MLICLLHEDEKWQAGREYCDSVVNNDYDKWRHTHDVNLSLSALLNADTLEHILKEIKN